MPEEKKDGKEVRESNEESVIVKVNAILEVMDSLSTQYIPPQAYQDMWEDLYLRLSKALSDKQPKEDEENPVMDDDEGVEEDYDDIPSEQPTTPPPKPSRPKMKEDLLDDDLLA